MTGSLRNRGQDTWQLRVYLGVDAATRRQRWATTTVHGSRRHARAQLAEFARQADEGRLRAGTVSDLLDRWAAAASPKWSPNTKRETRSVIEHHVKPHLGHMRVEKLTAQDVDDFYGYLLSSPPSRSRSRAASSGALRSPTPIRSQIGYTNDLTVPTPTN